MGATVERFKGIEFVRISSLTKDQQQQLWTSFDRDKIIKIVRDQSLLNDCILYSDFVAWKSHQPTPTPSAAADLRPTLGKLAFE